jgi:hypothetical protein
MRALLLLALLACAHAQANPPLLRVRASRRFRESTRGPQVSDFTIQNGSPLQEGEWSPRTAATAALSSEAPTSSVVAEGFEEVAGSLAAPLPDTENLGERLGGGWVVGRGDPRAHASAHRRAALPASHAARHFARGLAARQSEPSHLKAFSRKALSTPLNARPSDIPPRPRPRTGPDCRAPPDYVQSPRA